MTARREELPDLFERFTVAGVLTLVYCSVSTIQAGFGRRLHR